MARAMDWARVDALTAQGLSARAIARELEIPWTTFYRAQRHRQGPPAPVQKPGPRPDTGAVSRAGTDAEQTLDTGAGPRVDSGAVQTLRAEVAHLNAQLQDLTQVVQAMLERPVPTPVQITALPPYPKGKAVRWNLWLLDAIRAELATLAAQRDLSPSQLVVYPQTFYTDLNPLCCNVREEAHPQSQRWWEHAHRRLTTKLTWVREGH